jgi:hypothetical protein
MLSFVVLARQIYHTAAKSSCVAAADPYFALDELAQNQYCIVANVANGLYQMTRQEHRDKVAGEV